MALLHLAARAQKLRNAPKFTVLSVDHGLRAEARQEVAFVAETSRHLGVRCKILRWRGDKPHSGIQEAARNARYTLMAEVCKKAKIPALVTAHHAGDQLETMLMRLARGTDLAGVVAMRAKRELDGVLLLRPMLALHPTQLREVCMDYNVRFIDDPSNRDLRFERVRWRGVAEQIFAAGLTAEKLALTSARLDAVNQDLDRLVAQAWLALENLGGTGIIALSRTHFESLVPSVQRRLLQHLFLWVGNGVYAPSPAQIERTRDMICSGGRTAMTIAGCLLRPRQGSVLFGREFKAVQDLVVPLTGRSAIWDGRYEITRRGRAPKGHIRALGAEGLKQLDGMECLVDKSVPASLMHALPAIFNGETLAACPVLAPIKGLSMRLITPFATN